MLPQGKIVLQMLEFFHRSAFFGLSSLPWQLSEDLQRFHNETNWSSTLNWQPQHVNHGGIVTYHNVFLHCLVCIEDSAVLTVEILRDILQSCILLCSSKADPLCISRLGCVSCMANTASAMEALCHHNSIAQCLLCLSIPIVAWK